MKLGIVILAAGQGTRMKSALPKVLHPMAGKPLLGHVLDTAERLAPEKIVVVYGHGGEQVKEAFVGRAGIHWVEQVEQLGTGHAVQQALPLLDGLDQVLILYGDVPMTARSTLARLIGATPSDLGLLTLSLADASGYGRIVRDASGNVQCIVEHKDASPDELAIREINTGIMLLGSAKLRDWLGRLSNENSQQEYYLTDVIAMAVHDGVVIHVEQPADPVEAEGVNNRRQLAELERTYQRARANELLLAGVTLIDPARFDLRGELEHGADVTIDVNVIIEGHVVLGDNVRVGANTVLRNVVVGDDVVILENCILEDSEVGPASKIGPYARLRPGTVLTGSAHVGNFVEIKKSLVGQGSKVNHLTYVGDADIGAGVNVGAGTITCNYDGANKHKTTIGDGAFIGSNTSLVAPVNVAEGATIGAGSVISKDAPADKLTVTRAPQLTIDAWTRPIKQPKE